MRNATENVPCELLGDIFLFALTYIPGGFPNIYQSRSRLTRVCRGWRNVAISDPRLWTTIVLEEPDFILPTLSFLQLCIERSSNLPLSIYLTGTLEERQWLSPPMFDLTWAIGAEIHRWKSFTCVAHVDTITPLRTLAGLQFDFPSTRQLRSIKIDINQQGSDRSLYDFYAELAHLPALRELSISAPNVFDANPSPWNPSREILTSTQTTESWARFTRLYLDSDMTWQDVVFLLKYCSSVKLMRLNLWSESASHPIRERLYVTQNTLRALRINFEYFTQEFSQLIAAVTFPHLEIFQYEESQRWGDERGENRGPHWNNFLNMVSRSPHLQVLIMHHSAFGPEQLLELVSHSVITRIPTVQMLIDIYEEEDDLPSGNNSWDCFYRNIMDQGPDNLVQAMVLPRWSMNLLVGWVEEWITLKEFEGVGRLADGGFALHPALELASCPL